MRIFAALLLLGLASEVWSTELQNIKATVFLQDNATNGCWTNLKETREYAEEKLRMNNIQIGNFDVPEFTSNEFWLWIEVSAGRTNSGSCTGLMNVQLISFITIGEQMYTIVRNSNLGHAFLPNENFNNHILDYVNQIIGGIK